MGIVYKARHQLLNKTIAVKLALNTEHSTNLHRFHREAQAASRLRHTNIVTVHEFGCTDGNQFYMVMDCVEGPTLADVIQDRGRLPLDQAIDIFIQLCDAVAHAHENAVLHRDLKPENILLTMSGTGQTTAHVVDFGIAKLIEPHNTLEKSLTHTGQLFGSPLYMSPEQAMGSPADARSDIYALGCIMYETLVGVPPLSGESFMSTLMKHVREIPVSLREASLGEVFPQQI
jgi:serine/threonine-protein kinase